MNTNKTCTISPAQGLLLIIEQVYKKQKQKLNNPKITIQNLIMGSPIEESDEDEEKENLDLKELISSYLLGAEDCDQELAIKELLNKHFQHTEYEVSYDYNIISDDPTRRFFETHLAFLTLKYGLNSPHLSLEELQKHNILLRNTMLSIMSQPELDSLLEQTIENNDEFYNLYLRIKHKEFGKHDDFSEQGWKKILAIANSWIYSWSIAKNFNLPIDIYNEGYFADSRRGRKDRKDVTVIYTQNLGLMKSNMPLPRDDVAFDKRKAQPGFKSSDLVTFVPGKEWVDHSFQYFVHPFSNSISGTMLVQLRCLAMLHEQKLPDPVLSTVNKMARYFRLFAALLIFNSGGHSWFEFIEPIKLDKVRDTFKTISNFSKLDMRTIVFQENERAVYEAITDAIEYNNNILKKHKMRAELLTATTSDHSILTSPKPQNYILELTYNILSNPLLLNKFTAWNQEDNSENIPTRSSSPLFEKTNEAAKLMIKGIMHNSQNFNSCLTILKDFLSNSTINKHEKYNFYNFIIHSIKQQKLVIKEYKIFNYDQFVDNLSRFDAQPPSFSPKLKP